MKQDEKLIHIDERIHLIDGFDLGMPQRTGTYVIEEEKLTLVETGPSPSIPYIRKGLAALGYSTADVNYVIVTHIHLDHAGGAGVFIKDCPNAKVVVHPKGARHLANPKRLIAGAKAVYHHHFDPLFDPVEPVPDEKIIVKNDGETLRIGPQCELEFLDTPGHANHHFSIYDPISHGAFTGDTAGIRYQPLVEEGVPFYLPSTSPNQFDPEKMRRSIERLKGRKLDRIYFGHFGMASDVDVVYEQVLRWLDVFMEEGERIFQEEGDPEALTDVLLDRLRIDLEGKKVPQSHPVFEVLQLDMKVCALGIMDYLAKR